MALTIARPVVIKAIVTESFKRLYTQELQTAITRTDELVGQIDTQIRRTELERQITPQSRGIRQQLDVERARQEATRAELQARLREVEALELNSEFPQGTVESFTEVNVGDNLFQKLGRTEIVVKDGIIIELREE
jgi:predicted TIM-barrel fold metal-dependent hydrolase